MDCLSVVDVAAVTEGDDDDQEHVISDRVDDPVVTDSDAVAPSTTQGPRGRGMRVRGQEGDCSVDAGLDIMIASSHSARSGRTDSMR